jgi:protein-tyrosine phosphatase
MAEGLFKKLIRNEGLEKFIHVESRATSTYEIGRPPHPRTQAILHREDAMLVGKRAEQITHSDIESFDIIIGMDKENVMDLKHMTKDHHKKIYLFRDINPLTKDQDVPDPYYSGRYEETYQLIQESLPLWLERLKKT